MEDYENEEEDIDICDDPDTEEGEGADDGIGNAAAEGWNKIGEKKPPVLEKPPYCPGPDAHLENRLHDLLLRSGTQSGEVQFTKAGQERVELNNGFNYTQNTDGSMVVRDTAGNTFVVAADNTLTVVRAGGQVETYKPQLSHYKDGGSVGYGYPAEAGFHMVRKNRGFGREADTGVEINVGNATLSTVVQRGRAATYEYQPAQKDYKSDAIKKVAS